MPARDGAGVTLMRVIGTEDIPVSHNAFVFVVTGQVFVVEDDNERLTVYLE